MVKTCPQCDGEFKTYRRAAIYCGKACQDASQVRALTLECAECGGSFVRARSTAKKAKVHFCSPGCHQANIQAVRRVADCAVCSKPFHPSTAAVRCCSWACRNASLRRRTTRNCDQCGQGYTRRNSRASRFCSHRCATDHNSGANHHAWTNRRHLEYGKGWLKISEAIRVRDGDCRRCGKTPKDNKRALDVHHITPRRTFLMPEAFNHASNLAALCRSCHMTVDSKILRGRTDELPKWLRPLA